jgi:hypothetical protein
MNDVKKRKEFFAKYCILCTEYDLALVPLSSGEPNCHDSLGVVEIDEDIDEYIGHTSVYQDASGDWFS